MSVVVLALVSALVGKRKLSAWTDKNRAYHFATHDHGSCDDTFEDTAPRTARALRRRGKSQEAAVAPSQQCNTHPRT
jgi:hypothetical protein